MRLALHYKNNTEEYEDHVLEELRLHELDEDDFDFEPDNSWDSSALIWWLYCYDRYTFWELFSPMKLCGK